MLVETRVALPLRSRFETVVPTGWVEGLSNWWLDGAWVTRVSEPVLGPGGAAARLHAVVKRLDPSCRAALGDGVSEPFEAVGTEEAPAGLGAVPEAWAGGLVDGTAHVVLSFDGLLATVTARYASRTRVGVPALRLVVRGVRADLLPFDGPDPTYPADLFEVLGRPGSEADLRDLLADAGQALGKALADGFADQVDAPAEVRTQVQVYERTDGLDEVLRGLPRGTRLHLQGTGAWFAQRKPKIEVLRRRRDGTIELWRGDEVSGG